MNVYIKTFSLISRDRSDRIFLPNGANSTVKELKLIIEKELKYEYASQQLQTKICGDFLVLLADSFPLSFFHILENHSIRIIIIEKERIEEKIVKNINIKKSKFLGQLQSLGYLGSNTGLKGKNKFVLNANALATVPEDVEVGGVNDFKNDKNEKHEEYKYMYHFVLNNNISGLKKTLNDYKNLNLNFLYKNGWGPLHMAAYYGFTHILIELLKFGADPNFPSKEKWTPLHFASHKGKDEIVRELLSLPSIEPNVSLDNIGTPLHIACKKSWLKCVSLLLLVSKTE